MKATIHIKLAYLAYKVSVCLHDPALSVYLLNIKQTLPDTGTYVVLGIMQPGIRSTTSCTTSGYLSTKPSLKGGFNLHMFPCKLVL